MLSVDKLSAALSDSAYFLLEPEFGNKLRVSLLIICL